MKGIDTSLFPYPHWYKDEKRNGSSLKWQETCLRCRHNRCNELANNEIQICSYGYNYIRIDKNIIIAGIILRDVPINSEARRKLIKKNSKLLIPLQMFNESIETLRNTNNALAESIEKEKNLAMEKYVKSEKYKTEFLTTLKDEIQKGLSFVHDYKQINTQITQNINVIIENRYQGTTFEEKLNKSSGEEKSIYEASKLLDEKLNVAKFLMHPEWLLIKDECKSFRFHGLFIKYRRIYTSLFENKKITVSVHGQSNQEIIANAQAVSVIPQTFLDNAAKYSPSTGGRVDIYIQDIEDGIEFSVSSFGPKILSKEKEKIFDPFYRGEHAKKVEEEGAGYGLYICQLIAKTHLGTTIEVEQDNDLINAKGYWTSFSVRIPLKAIIV